MYRPIRIYNIFDTIDYSSLNVDWDIKKVIALLDSITNDFPIGLIVLSYSDDRKFRVIDGKNRLMSLYKVIYQDFDDEKWNILYNLETQKFEEGGKEESLTLVPFRKIYDTFELLKLKNHLEEDLEDKEKAKKYINNLKRINSKFQTYDLMICTRDFETQEEIEKFRENSE